MCSSDLYVRETRPPASSLPGIATHRYAQQTMTQPANLSCPDGLDQRSLEEGNRLRRHANPLSALILGGILVLAAFGVLGGEPDPTIEVNGSAASLSVTSPRVLRNGVFFESVVRVTPHRPVRELVIGIPPSLWRHMTINSMIPAASDEIFEDGLYRFSFGEIGAGRQLVLKIDGQINPSLWAGTKGTIVAFDNRVVLAQVPIEMTVIP